MRLHHHYTNHQKSLLPSNAWQYRCVAAAVRVATPRARIALCNATSSRDEASEPPRTRMRRTRLFRQTDSSSEEGSQPPAAAQPASSTPVSEEFKKAFESLGVKPVGVKKLSRATLHSRQTKADSGDDSSSDQQQQERRPGPAAAEAGRSRRFSHEVYDDDRDVTDSRPRPSRTNDSWRERSDSSGGRPYPSRSAAGGRAAGRDRPWERMGSGDRWQQRGRVGAASSTSSTSSSSKQRQRWEQEAEERARAEEEAERKRLIRKARSETIPTKPKRTQDPIIFQALTREWDERVTKEEYRGARAAARKTARIGIKDRNKGLKQIRRKLIRSAAAADPEKLDPEAAAVAARAAAQIQNAASKSIQKTKELLYQEAAGVKRSFARAEALPEGEWERLKEQYRSNLTPIKIGRKGASPALISQIQAAWRGSEVVKLAIHDDKSARKMNLPRLNVLLQELEERSGGVLVDQQGASIWMYRGVDWTPAPVPPPYKPPPPHEHFQQQHTPRGSWKDIAGISCYVVSSSEAADVAVPPSSSEAAAGGSAASSSSSGDSGSSGDSSSSSGVGDAMTVLLLPDQFPMADSSILMQMADRVAAKGALVIMPDLLGPKASAINSSIATKGKTVFGSHAGYWRVNWWPVVKKRKLDYMEWYNAGPGSWTQQRPRLLQLLEELQQQGLYDKDAGSSSSSSSSGGSSGGSSSSSSDRALGILGLGWGTYIGFKAAGDDECVAAGLKAVAAMSPVTCYRDVDLANALQLPVALLPAKYDPMEQMMITIDLLQRPYAQRCVFKRYGKVKPGWAHWLPQWADKRAMYQAAEGLLLSVAYLKRELMGIDSELLPPPALTQTPAAATAGAATAAAAAAAADKEVEEAEEAEDAEDEAVDEAEEEGQEDV